jgi:hypothetical protein
MSKSKYVNAWEEFRKGWEVVGILAKGAVLGNPRVTLPSPSGAFYLLGWWWEGEHILIPEQLEEERITKELEETFSEKKAEYFFSDAGGGIGVNTPNIRVRTGPYATIGKSDTTPLIAKGSVGLVVNPSSGSSVGYWSWESVKIGISKPPSLVRQWILQILLGVKYEPIQPLASNSPTTKSSPTPLSMLSKYLDSVKTSSTQIL